MSKLLKVKNIIRILPESLINKIAAGEVVERPSSVVKELLENSIDAGASDIQVLIKNGGKDLISIIDNGCGMNETDARLSFERHATSKISNDNDLFNIKTLGFRGEALAAISSVSHFELLTCDNKKKSGTRLFIKGGNIEQIGKIGFPKGTKIKVEKLFYNTPARQKFLKTTTTELQHIQQHIVQKALSNPNIHFRLTHNQQILFNLPRCKDLGIRIEQIFGGDFKEILMSVKHKETYIKFEGFISFPSKARTSRKWQYIFLNGRNVRSIAINHGLYGGYGTFLGKNQHPAFFLNIFISPSEIDVNVHPAKTEIRFRNSHLIHTILVDQISRLLKDGASRKFFGHSHLRSKNSSFELYDQMDLPIKDSLDLSKPDIENKKPSTNIVGFPKKKFIQNNNGDSQIGNNSKKYKYFEQNTDFKDNKKFHESSFAIEIRNISHLSPHQNYPLDISSLGQFLRRYIVANKNDDLFFFNQKMLFEKILYELFLSALQKKNVISCNIKNPIIIGFSSQESEILTKYLNEINCAGFSVSPFGKNTFSFYARPEILLEFKLENTIKEIISSDVFTKKINLEAQIFKKISYILAKNGEFNFLEELNKVEIDFLLAQWENLGSPLQSIDENPLFFKFNKKELENHFK